MLPLSSFSPFLASLVLSPVSCALSLVPFHVFHPLSVDNDHPCSLGEEGRVRERGFVYCCRNWPILLTLKLPNWILNIPVKISCISQIVPTI